MDEEKLVSSLKEAFVPMFERIETKLDVIDDRLDKIEARLDNVEADVKDIKGRLTNVEKRLDNVEKRLDNVEIKLDNVEKRLDNVETKLDNVEKRVTNVEQDVRFIKLNIETEIIPRLDGLREGRQAILEKNKKLEKRVNYVEKELNDFIVGIGNLKNINKKEKL